MSLRHYLVSGHVQGVGFRRFVEKQAKLFQVSGCVRNLDDGRVEFLAQGSDDDLQELEVAVQRGPMLSAVRGIEQKAVDERWLADWLQQNPKLAKSLVQGDFAVAADGELPWI